MNKETELTISVVTYKNNGEILRELFNSLTSINLKTKIFVIDNSPSDALKNLCNKEFIYIFNNKNIGFGQGHNIAIRQMLHLSKYHLVINPDIFFEKGEVERIYAFMENNPDVGLLMPKIFSPNGNFQYLCRLLPTPLGLLLRRINLPFFSKRQNFKYELQFANYSRILDIPFLSGCFMFVRNDVFERVGLFDERFFMYFEDLDLSRRVHMQYRTIYYPQSAVIHENSKESSKDTKLLFYHIVCSIKYFNKWGWFFDKERRLINSGALRKIKRL